MQRTHIRVRSYGSRWWLTSSRATSTSRSASRLSRACAPALLGAVVLSLSLFFVSPVHAEEHVLALDPGKTEVQFVLGATGHKVHGRLSMTEGEIRFDPVTGSVSGAIVLDAKGADTGNPKRDKKMHSKVLLSEKYTTARFAPERIEGQISLQGASEFVLHGTITLLGEDHPASLETKATIEGAELFATATFVLPYVEWGLEDPSVLVLRVAKTVDVTIEAVGKIATPNP